MDMNRVSLSVGGTPRRHLPWLRRRMVQFTELEVSPLTANTTKPGLKSRRREGCPVDEGSRVYLCDSPLPPPEWDPCDQATKDSSSTLIISTSCCLFRSEPCCYPAYSRSRAVKVLPRDRVEGSRSLEG